MIDALVGGRIIILSDKKFVIKKGKKLYEFLFSEGEEEGTHFIERINTYEEKK